MDCLEKVTDKKLVSHVFLELLRGRLHTECGLLVQPMKKVKHCVNKNNLNTTGIIEKKNS